MDQLRSELRKRQQDEPAVGYLRMGYFERALTKHERAEKQDVEVDDAAAPALALDPLSTHRALHALELLQQILGGQVGLDLDCAVDEPRPCVAVRLALVERRLLDDTRVGQPADALEGVGDVGAGGSEVGSQAEEDPRRHWVSRGSIFRYGRPLLPGGRRST